MYMGISELKRVKDAIKHITNVFCKIIKHKSKDAMSKTSKYKFKFDIDTQKQLHIDPGKILGKIVLIHWYQQTLFWFYKSHNLVVSIDTETLFFIWNCPYQMAQFHLKYIINDIFFITKLLFRFSWWKCFSLTFLCCKRAVQKVRGFG